MKRMRMMRKMTMLRCMVAVVGGGNEGVSLVVVVVEVVVVVVGVGVMRCDSLL